MNEERNEEPRVVTKDVGALGVAGLRGLLIIYNVGFELMIPRSLPTVNSGAGPLAQAAPT